jgi:hypothetical protein
MGVEYGYEFKEIRVEKDDLTMRLINADKK